MTLSLVQLLSRKTFRNQPFRGRNWKERALYVSPMTCLETNDMILNNFWVWQWIDSTLERARSVRCHDKINISKQVKIYQFPHIKKKMNESSSEIIFTPCKKPDPSSPPETFSWETDCQWCLVSDWSQLLICDQSSILSADVIWKMKILKFSPCCPSCLGGITLLFLY